MVAVIRSQSRHIQYTTLGLLCVLLAAVSGQAVEAPWQGTLSSRVNLRMAPGLSGKIITGIDRGQVVTVENKHEDWLQVTVNGNGFRLTGWIYGKYVQPSETIAAPTAVAPMAAEPPSPAPAAVKQAALAEPAKPEVAMMAAPAPTAAFPESQEAPEKPVPARQAEQPFRQPTKVASPSTPDHSAEPAIASAADVKAPAAPMPAKPTQPTEQAPADFQSSQAVASTEKVQPPEVIFRRDDEPVKPQSTPKPQKAEKPSFYVFIHLGLRLATVLLASLAFLFSIKAMRLARAAHQPVI